MSIVSKINGISVPNTFVTGFTYDTPNKLTISQNGRPDLDVYLNEFSGVTITGKTITGQLQVTGGTLNSGYILTSDGVGNATWVAPYTASGYYLPLSGGTVTGPTIFNSGLTANTIYTDVLSFYTGYTGTTNAGSMTWNTDFGVPQIGMLGGNVVQKVGETIFSYVRNAETTTLNKGEVVYIFGATGDKISVKRASNTGDTTSSKTLGVVAENITSGGLGYVITQGTLDGLNLGSYTAGTVVWLDSVPGQFTSTKQYAPNHLVFVGVIQRANNGNGQLYVKPQNGYEMEELHDVMSTGATYGDLLVYSAYSGYNVWVSSKTLTGNYTVNGDLTVTGNTSQVGTYTHSGDTFITGDTNQIGDFYLTGDTTHLGIYTHSGNTFITGNTEQIGYYYITGNTSQEGNYTHSGNTFITGNTNQIGDITLSGDTFITGNTTQLGIYTHSGDTFITGDTTQIGDITLSGDSFITGTTNQLGDFNLSGNSIIQSGVTASSYNISVVPTLNNTLFQILGRNENTGEVEYRQVNTVGNNITIITGGTYSAVTTVDNVIGVDTTYTTTTIYLPDSVSSGRLRFEIKDIGLNAFYNPITIITSGSDTIISYVNTQTLIMESEGGAIILLNTGLGQWWQM